MKTHVQNDFQKLLRERRSVRKFTHDPVPAELITAAIDDVRFSPTPTNRQCYKFIGVSDPLILQSMRIDVLARIEEIAARLAPETATSFKEYAGWFTFFDQAPLVLFGLYRLFASRLPDGEESSRSLEGIAELQAFGGAIHALILSLHARGLGSCWMSGPLIAADKLETLLAVESPWRLGAVIPVGKPAQKPVCPRKPDSATVFSYFPAS
ncbi:MAG: nitroreductase family protein [Candidatus Riflebacteria bacterium]|nr:nitroreductase family protein [Candidatus Riflebacteria bacterium]